MTHQDVLIRISLSAYGEVQNGNGIESRSR